MDCKYNKQRGFTLVEIAIVLVIIGLLLGGILKGQELINSARVRNLADMNSGIQAAYYGFIDRYRQVPGDWSAAAATTAIGVTVNTGGNGNGQIDIGDWTEAGAVWEQLSKAGFIQGNYPGSAANTEAAYTATGVAPVNAFNGTLLLGRGSDYSGTAADRLNLALGDNIPVNIARELDVKIDDSVPNTGVLRENGQPGSPDWGGVTSSTSTNCQATSGGAQIYDIASDAQNCNLSFLY
jgi:prepilin-type N-terminal cleavage/methylation domain-containing protein